MAGVYNSASGTFGMTGTLTLDGENNADAIFIFQTASTLITGGTGNVSLIRGAQACNIFWKVGSAATLGAGSTFRGTILAHDDISLGDGVTVDGRLLAGEQASGAGAVTLIHDTIIKPTCVTPTTTSTTTTTATTTTRPRPQPDPDHDCGTARSRGDARPDDDDDRAAATTVAAATTTPQRSSRQSSRSRSRGILRLRRSRQPRAQWPGCRGVGSPPVVKHAAAKKKAATSKHHAHALPARAHAGFTG